MLVSMEQNEYMPFVLSCLVNIVYCLIVIYHSDRLLLTLQEKTNDSSYIFC